MGKQARGPEARPSRGFEDFSEDYGDRDVLITLHDGRVIKGRVVAARRYWFKVLTSTNHVLYINKAFVVSIEVGPW